MTVAGRDEGRRSNDETTAGRQSEQGSWTCVPQVPSLWFVREPDECIMVNGCERIEIGACDALRWISGIILPPLCESALHIIPLEDSVGGGGRSVASVLHSRQSSHRLHTHTITIFTWHAAIYRGIKRTCYIVCGESAKEGVLRVADGW